MNLWESELPVAASMRKLARNYPLPELAKTAQPMGEALIRFTCYWIAFNNIYAVIAERKSNSTGRLTERRQLELTFLEFPGELKDQLVGDGNVEFFVYRTPLWHGQPIERNSQGELVNGVLKVGHTQSAEDPRWSGIDRTGYERYFSGYQDPALRDCLAKQVFWLVYAVRNNTFHGGKIADAANDREVLVHATPLLEIMVEGLVHWMPPRSSLKG